MNTYEMIYCFKPTLDPDSVELAITEVEGYITKLDGKIIKTDKLGRKKLSYEISKFKDGFYATSYFTIKPEHLKTIKRSMKLNENVIREMTIKLEKPNLYLSSPVPAAAV